MSSGISGNRPALGFLCTPSPFSLMAMHTPAPSAPATGWLNRLFPLLCLLGALAHATGLYADILEPDGMLYATIARLMAENGDWMNLYARGADWLDKPHFPFWMTAFSFKIFGVNSVAYKLPGLLFYYLGAWYTYQLARHFYPRATAQLAVLLYFSALHLFLSNLDLRAEAYLGTLITGSVLYLLRDARQPSWKNLLPAALLGAAAVMTKGIFVLLPLMGGYMVYLFARHGLKTLVLPRLWIFALALLVFTLPELISLYVQFDRHPEKLVFDRKGVSGLRFFFWDSQFGRFFNNGPIKGHGDPFLYVHTLLWAFAPWAIAAYGALFRNLSDLRRGLARDTIVLPLNIVLTLLLFSASRFQLPHYANILYPMLAVLTAHFLMERGGRRGASVVALCFALLTVVVVGLFLVATGLTAPATVLCLLLPALAGAVLVWKRTDGALRPAALAYMLMLSVFAALSFFAYPALMQYQAGAAAGRYLNKHHPEAVVAPWRIPYADGFAFYTKKQIRYEPEEALRARWQRGDTVWLFLPKGEQEAIRTGGVSVQRVAAFPYFPVSQLKPGFLMPASRHEQVDTQVLVRVWRDEQ